MKTTQMLDNLILTDLGCEEVAVLSNHVKDSIMEFVKDNQLEMVCVCALENKYKDLLLPIFNQGINKIFVDHPVCFIFSPSKLIHLPFRWKQNYILNILPTCPDIQINGVFCDISGTLIQENVINKVLVHELREKEKQGWKITLWTGGSIDNNLRAELQSAGITWPVVKKYDYRGKRVAIAYDDETRESLYSKYGISVTDLTVV